MDLGSCSHQFLTEFIEIYRSNPCLWRFFENNQCNKSSRVDAYKILLEKLKEIDENADHAAVVNIIEDLRNNFLTEYRKKAKDPSYESSLWYYPKMEFILVHDDDDLDAYAVHIAGVLRNMPSEERIKLQKVISNVISKCLTGEL